MAKNTTKKDSAKTKKTSDIAPEVMAETKEAKNDSAALNGVLARLSQQFNLLALLIIALFLFQAYTFYKVNDLAKNGVSGGAGNVAGAANSPLSQDNLIAYAEELELDKDAFEQCLTSGDKASLVQADIEQATSFDVSGTPGFFVNGRFLGGAFPYEFFKEIIDKEIAGEGSSNCEDYSEELQTYCSDPANQAFKPEPQEVALGDAPSVGPEDAAVTIVEFSDFECPFCARAYSTVKQIQNEYPNDVRIVYKQLPLTNIHPNAQRAAEASLCARDQGKFWEMHDKMFEVQGA